MKKVSLAILFSLGAIATSAFAQSDQGVRMSTDPSVAADVESRAQSLQSQQESMQNMQMQPQSKSHKSMHHKKMQKSSSSTQ